LIGRAAHVSAITKNGLKIVGCRGDHLVRENLRAVTHPAEIDRPIDYYIVLTKAKDVASALNDAQAIAPHIGCALSLQNGLGKEQQLIDCFGSEKVIGGSIIESAMLVAPGVVRNGVTVPVTAYFGELSGGASARAETIADAFSSAGLGARAVNDIAHVLWEKAVQVGGASSWSASTLVGTPALDYWDGLASITGAAHYVQIAKELLAVYRALGYTPQNFFAPLSRLKEIDAASATEITAFMNAMGRERQLSGREPVRTSMHEDLLAGRMTEIDVILKPLLDMAETHGVAVPTVLGAYRIIKTLESYMH
jgi:2-dehydropantoate 2-reductase